MAFRRWAISIAACFLMAGCAAPQTFVAEAPSEDADPFAAQLQPSETENPTHKAEANPEKPSAWSGWMGAFTKSPASKAPSKPIERIPLPRTDREIPMDSKEAEAVPDHETDF
jgi:hypothetical protein